MSSYLSALILSSALVTLTALLSPEGKTGRGVRFVVALVGLLVIAAPLLSLREGAQGWEESLLPEGTEDSEAVVHAYEDAVASGLAQALGLEKEKVQVDILASFDGGYCQIETVWIRIEGSFDGEAARAYLDRTLPRECEVMLFGG